MSHPIPSAFEFDYRGTQLVYGRNAISQLGDFLDARGLAHTLIVCGSHVGANDAVMDPLRRGLGDRPVDVFDETTPRKSATTVFEGVEVVERLDPDVIVGIGGGSSLDIARQMSIFHADGRSLDELREAALDGTFNSPEPDDATDVVVVPTTFAGADISSGGNFEVVPRAESPTGQPIFCKGRLWPIGVCFDPALVETTPAGALAGSAMNGFNKAVETLYTPPTNAITDSTAVRSLQLLSDAYPKLLAGEAAAIERATVGTVLAQFDRRLSVLHGFGHGFARRYHTHQGRAHAVVTPAVLEYVFEQADARRALLAEGLGIDAAGRSAAEIADRIIDELVAIRDSLALPSRIRELDGVSKAELPALARFIAADHRTADTPDAFRPDEADIERILHSVW